jgi:hypothetical protein
MRMYEITCSACGASFDVAESETVVGSPGQKNCSACGNVLTSWGDRKLKAFRLVMSPKHRYALVPGRPAFFYSLAGF